MSATKLVILLLHLPTVVVFWDAYRLPNHAWRASGIPRPAFLIPQVLTGFLGAVMYVVAVRPRVVSALHRD